MDKAYAPILQAILFCVVYLGFFPRIATERSDSGENRLQKIREFIEGSKYSIHDLSRSQAVAAGDLSRLNMPFELGIDYGCRLYFGSGRESKKTLILEEIKYRYQASISDISGFDIEAHSGDFQVAVRKVRNWLVSEAGVTAPGARRVIDAYEDFQEWYYERQLSVGFSDEDIRDYPTIELLAAMKEWIELGRPV